MTSHISGSEKNSRPTLLNSRNAIVMGGSMAGMLAARVLSRHFDQVFVIERDQFPTGPTQRPGTPQARHVHVLLARGLQVFEEFFPGLCGDLMAAGALEIEAGSDLAWLNPAGWGVNFSSGVKALSFSRNLLDWVVRRRLAAISNIHFLENCDVTELITSEAGDYLGGVSFRRRSNENGARGEESSVNLPVDLEADLVVDATGRASRMPQWLSALGYERPAETVINAHLGYASRIYEIPEGFKAAWKGVFIQAAPPDHRRGGLLMPIEGNRWLVTLVGGDRDYPPMEEEGFLEFARGLRSSIIYDAIRNAQPLSLIAIHRGTENRRRHYEQLKRFPEGLIVTGDGACAFNPVYGQGMTTAALGAQWLDRCLRDQFAGGQKEVAGLGRRFQQGLAKLNADPWMLATGEDYRYRNAEGGSPNRFNRFMHAYVDQVLQLTTHHAGIRRRFLEVQGMLKPPKTLFSPGIALRVLGNPLRNFFRQAKTTGQTIAEASGMPIGEKSSAPDY